MSSSTPSAAEWPEPAAAIFALLAGFALSISLAALGGRQLVEILLPLLQAPILWLDDRFAILFLGIDHTAQDTVIRLRVNLIRLLVIGTHVVEPHPKGWLEVTTTVGAMLQPLTIGLGLALAWPGRISQRLARAALACAGDLLFMLVDIPLTLHAYTWDMFLAAYDPGHFSPLMTAHRFLHGGGRLGIGVALGTMAILALSQNRQRDRQASPETTETKAFSDGS
ncbi:MAG: hypothetical protein ABIG35_09520 [Pseudomonadota bacterium]